MVELRSVLGEDARKPRIIRTVARFGYAFSAKAVVEADRARRGRGGVGLTYRVVWGRREISLDPGDNLIGRDPEAVVWIDDDSVSRRHARISIGEEGASIEDLGSRNGTWIGDARIRAARAAGGSGRRDGRAGAAEAARPPARGLHAFHRQGAALEVTLPAGTRLSSYEIVRSLGAGGMGQVYRARDTKLSRDVALKVLLPELAGDADRLARFESEARTASALNHPNIVTIYEIGRAEQSSFIAMELIEGKTLRELLADGPVPAKKLVSLAAQMSEGLAKAHAAGIVHRDLKPENVMVTRDGFVKILDFGLAKLVRRGFEGSDGAQLQTMPRGTHAGTILGTVGYMSPEQASGEPADFRSDQFSFGSILYELASGRRAFERPTDAQTLSAIIEAEPPPLLEAAPRLPTSVAGIVDRCLAKDPEDRYGSTKDLARDLAALRDQSSGASAPGVATTPGRRLRLSPAVLAGAAVIAAGLAVLAFVAGQRVQARRDREAPPPKRTAMTFRRGFLTGARFAPDGQTIVYSASWDGRPSEIFTTRVGSTESRALGIAPADILAVSSTGEMAVLLGCTASAAPCVGTLARVPLAGGTPREILEDVVSADWSPDGKNLAVIRRRGSAARSWSTRSGKCSTRTSAGN